MDRLSGGRSILEENYVLGPGIKKPKQTTKTTPGGTGLFEDDPDVTEYSSLEDLHLIETEKQEILTRVQPISEEDQAKMKAEAKRTGLGGSALFKHIENPPDDLKKENANSVVSGKQKSAPPSWVRAILETYSKQPDQKYNLISTEDQAKMKEEAERTGLNGYAIFKYIESPPDGLTKNNANVIVSGKYKSAPPSWVKAILDEYGRQPNAKYEPISEEDKAKMKAEEKRTGLGGIAIFKHIENPPDGLTKGKANAIVSGNAKSALPSWVKAMLEAYRKQPDTTLTEERKPISAKDKAKMKAEEKRTGMGGSALFKHIENPPNGLTVSKATSLVSGNYKSAPPSWVKAILDVYRKQPDTTLTEKREPISEEDKAKMKAEEKRTGLGGVAIFKHIENPPVGLTKYNANSIVSGRDKSASPSWVKAILDGYSKQPDIMLTEQFEPISEEDKVKMKEEEKRTGMGGVAIFKHVENPPDGLTEKKAAPLVSGKRKSAPPSWVRAILDTYSKQPDTELTEKYEPISAEDKAKIKEEEERTTLGGIAIFNCMETPPDGLNKRKAGDIVFGKQKSAPPSWVKGILDTYSQQPDMELKAEFQKTSQEDSDADALLLDDEEPAPQDDADMAEKLVFDG